MVVAVHTREGRGGVLLVLELESSMTDTFHGCPRCYSFFTECCAAQTAATVALGKYLLLLAKALTSRVASTDTRNLIDFSSSAVFYHHAHHHRPHAPESDVVVVRRVGGLVDLLDYRNLQEGRLLLFSTALADVSAMGRAFFVPLAGNEDGVYAVG